MTVGFKVDTHIEMMMGSGMDELDTSLSNNNVCFHDILRQTHNFH
jgi:hypothetical protein